MTKLISAFGTAPEEFVASTVLDASEIKAHLVINYSVDGVESALSQISTDGLLFDLTDAGDRSRVTQAGIVTELESLDTMPTVVAADENGVFAITRQAEMEIYGEFSEFIAALNDALAAGERVTRFDAHGYFDDAQNQFSSTRLRVGLTE